MILTDGEILTTDEFKGRARVFLGMRMREGRTGRDAIEELLRDHVEPAAHERARALAAHVLDEMESTQEARAQAG
jgi:hypothetical protein